jgi:hypothetical protein
MLKVTNVSSNFVTDDLWTEFFVTYLKFKPLNTVRSHCKCHCL